MTDEELNEAGYRGTESRLSPSAHSLATDLSELNFPIDYPPGYPFGTMNSEDFKSPHLFSRPLSD